MKKNSKSRKSTSPLMYSPEENRAWFVRLQLESLFERFERLDEVEALCPCRTQSHKRARAHYHFRYSNV